MPAQSDANAIRALVDLLTSGGDSRIVVRPGSNTNIYGASPYPREMLGYAASTANDISRSAFAHLLGIVASGAVSEAMSARAYGDALDGLRRRIRTAYGLDEAVDIVFSPSGTDLEFVALQLAMAHSGKPVSNILLGSDEVGSGCILSAAGKYFASETVLCPRTGKGRFVEGFESTLADDAPVRDKAGRAYEAAEIEAEIDRKADEAIAAGRHALAHGVHGSKTGLVLPDLAGIDRLRASHGDGFSLVIDACQARIEAPAIAAYLERGAIVLLTGSKFMGGPPFSGFALVPPGFRLAGPMAPGLASLFRRAEWPASWPGLDHLPRSANPGLLLRLEAAIFELERFQALGHAAHERVIARFDAATQHLADLLGARRVPGGASASAIEAKTLSTIDITPLPGAPDFATAQLWHKVLAARGIRLGQPVKCVRLPSGDWGGTLRISLSMPLICELAALDDNALDARLARDIGRIADVLGAAARKAA